MLYRKIWLTSVIIIATLFVIVVRADFDNDTPIQAHITLDPQIVFQTITGWEATAQAGEQDSPAFMNYRDALYDLAANDLGINRLRVEIYSSAENPTDYFANYMNGTASPAEWKQNRQASINDNADPTTLDPRGFHFSMLDHTIENVFLPLQKRLSARGEKLWLNLTYVDFAESPFEHRNAPTEYAEFVLATYQHLQTQYGLVPDTWEVILEPDNTQWSGKQISEAMVAAGKLLQANGFTPAFIAPSATNMSKAIELFDEMMRVPGAPAYLVEFAYHRYSGVSDANLRAIAERAIKFNVRTAMLEHIGSDYQDLHQDLSAGRNSAWQQFTLAYPTDDNGAQYYWINDRDPVNPQINLGRQARFLHQYFKFIRAGAVRINATTTNTSFDPVAFINANGKYVVVVKTSTEGTFAVEGLPAGTYGLKYTTAHEYAVDLADATIGAGEALNVHIPSAGVITIYTKLIPGSVNP
ncbi:hypothetical protein ANRL1_02367 [Anaerolineae bacterium]|nr:hypothetical protein ANRL1_02367 [Anaerolineae bacterium]